MQFVGRQTELEKLEKQFKQHKFEFSVIYGRRRVGKTWLIRKFTENKPSIYFMGIEAGAATNLESMSKAVHQFSGHDSLAPFSGFEELFSYLAELASKRQIILVIDEFPYLASAVPEISSILQRFCDHKWADTQLHLILCGSSMSFMERQVLGVKSPLYGRRTAQYLLKPFNFFETREYLEPMPLEEIAILHAVTGGVAEYLSFIDQKLGLEDNIVSLFLDNTGRLYEEPANLLKQELREPRTYNDILDAIAGGASRSNEIATKSKLASGALNRYLDALNDLGIVKKERPLQNKQSKKTRYSISDGCFRFWYRFVMPNLNAIMSGLGPQVYQKIISPGLSEFMGLGFEQIFFDYFDHWNASGLLPDLVTSRGRWWGSNPVERCEEEIDLLGIGTEMVFYGEAKWRREKIDLAVIKDLEQKSQLIPADKRFYLLLSKTGFSTGAIEYCQGRKDIRLWSFLSDKSV